MFTPSPEFSTLKAFLSKIAQNSKHVGSTSCFRGFLKCKFCEEQQYIAGEVVCLPRACLKGEISEKEKQTEIKSTITWDPGPRRTSEQKKVKHFSSFNALLIRLRCKARSGKCQYVWCMCRMCTRIVCEKEKREQAGSIVAT